MRAGRFAAYGAVSALLALPSLVLLAVTAAGLVLSVVLVGVPLLLGGLLLIAAVARLDRWLVRRLTLVEVEEPEPWSPGQAWSRVGLVRVGRDTTFVLARTAVGIAALILVAAAAVVLVAGVGAVLVDGFVATGHWQSTAGVSSWWGPLLAVAALGVTAAVLIVTGFLQTLLATLLGPTESRRLERARHRQTAVDERARLAADLHDAVGHSLTVTTLQASAAARVVRTDPGFVEDTLVRIGEESRRALAEVDRALALLTGGTPSAAPDAQQLPDLLAALRAAGLDVTGEITLPPNLPGELSQTLYRIVQEAGTNALRHSTGDSVAVSVSPTGHHLQVTATSPLRPAGDQSSVGPGGGRGLDGLRARCERLDGSLTAGPSDDGQNWVVIATLPLDPRQGA